MRPKLINNSFNQDANTLREEARQIRQDIVGALFQSDCGGHYGGCLSVVEILLAIYRYQLRVLPASPMDNNRDRFILSKGHAALAHYAILRRLGFFNWPLDAYGSLGSPLEGHPDMTSISAIDFSTGSLGQGLSVGVGMAIGLRPREFNVWVVLGDGECQEGQVWEAAILASSMRLANLYAIIDANQFQEWGYTSPSGERFSTPPLTDALAKWRSFGWFAIECDGHDFNSLKKAFRKASQVIGRPKVIVAHTVKGCGVPLIEQNPGRFHCTSVTVREHRAILKSLSK